MIMTKKTQEQGHYNTSRVKNKNTTIKIRLCDALRNNGIISFVVDNSELLGKPDIVFHARKIAVFCDGDFYHGYNLEESKKKIKSNQEFWIDRIEKTISRDKSITKELENQGWTVLRFWGHEIKEDIDSCVDCILNHLRQPVDVPYRTIDLCAGIGGIRKGFELTGHYINVLSAEKDSYACKTYELLYGENPKNDLTSDIFKEKVRGTDYDVLMAGFPCQTFSRVGLEEGFENEEKGQIFFHIVSIIRDTRPCAIFLENVDHLTTHNGGKTFRQIINMLVLDLNYHLIGVSYDADGNLQYNPKSFVRNSRDFGMPQNRPRTYIIGFDRERFLKSHIELLPDFLPKKRKKSIYQNLNDVLEHDVELKYYMASGYLNTLIKHRERQEKKGYGFGYRIVNEQGKKNPIANTILATGGSGRERNLIYDPMPGVAGVKIKGKKTPLNDKGIRVMTPNEWGKLQGFVNYAFIGTDGEDKFMFPDGMPDIQRYKQFGNSVTIPVIEEMAMFMEYCLSLLQGMQFD